MGLQRKVFAKKMGKTKSSGNDTQKTCPSTKKSIAPSPEGSQKTFGGNARVRYEQRRRERGMPRLRHSRYLLEVDSCEDPTNNVHDTSVSQ